MKITLAVTNCQVVLERGIIWDATLLISENRIAEFGPSREINIPEGVKTVDAEGAYVGPGFVDIHVHSAPGKSTTWDAVEASEFFLAHGTTSLLSTPGYGFDCETMTKAMRTIKENIAKTKTVKGIYVEGPYMNPEYGAGAYKNPWRHPIDENEFKRFVDEAGDLVKIWAVAPEREGLVPFLEYARKVNPKVQFAIGHSEATPDQIRALPYKFKPIVETHCTNAMGRTNESRGIRGVGADEYFWTEPDLYTELISDSCCVHVKKEMQQLILRTKGVEKVVLITDSTSHNNPTPEKFAHVKDINFGERGEVSGSKLTMDQACRNIMTHTNCGIAQAFLMASTNPSKVIGLYEDIGSVEKGKIADLVLVDDRFNVKNVILGGELCY